MTSASADESTFTTPGPAPSPFLPGTNITYRAAEYKADWLLRSAYENDECLICHLEPNQKGYSNVSFGRKNRMRAHRLVYLVRHPNTDPDMIIMHTCDVRSCINPNHLVAGTPKENTADMISKGRDKFIQPRTDHAHRNDIIKLRNEGRSDDEIAFLLGISKSTVWNYTSLKGPYHE